MLSRLRQTLSERDGRAFVTMGVVLIGLVAYIVYAEVARAARSTAPTEYRLPLHPVSLAGAEVRGSGAATVGILVHSDFICPACGRFAIEILPRLEERYLANGKAFVALRHVAVGQSHAVAPRAAEAAYCAGEQKKYWEMYDSIFRAQLFTEYGRTEVASFDSDLESFTRRLGLDSDAFRSCLASDRSAVRVYADAGSALAYGIDSTPSLMIGTVDDGNRNRLRIARHFRGLPRPETLFEAVDALIATAAPPRSAQ
jgi:protein-disulfide isomerase